MQPRAVSKSDAEMDVSWGETPAQKRHREQMAGSGGSCKDSKPTGPSERDLKIKEQVERYNHGSSRPPIPVPLPIPYQNISPRTRRSLLSLKALGDGGSPTPSHAHQSHPSNIHLNLLGHRSKPLIDLHAEKKAAEDPEDKVLF